jgi:transcriptional regulator with XRE-family HTH domain
MAMTERDDDDHELSAPGQLGPVVIRRRLGAALRRLRVGQDYQLDVVARRLEFSTAKLSRLEAGQVTPKLRDVRDLLEMYGAPTDVRDQLMDWVQGAKAPLWWHPLSAHIPLDLDLYISLEAEARKLKIYSTPGIPSLLQTEEYAHETITGAAPKNTEESLVKLVDIRIKRQQVIIENREQIPPLDLHAIIDESALYRGPKDIVREQLRSLLQKIKLPNVTVQIYPYSASFDEAQSAFSIFEPRDEEPDWTVVNIEATNESRFLEGRDDVAEFEEIWADLSRKSLPHEETGKYIRATLARVYGVPEADLVED